jgi:hypothetical protein
VDEEYANGPAAFAPVPDLVRSPNTSVSSEEGDGTLGMQAIMEAALEGFDEYDEEADYLPQVFPDDSVSVAGARSGVRDDATATVTAGSNIEPTDDGWGGAPTYDDGWGGAPVYTDYVAEPKSKRPGQPDCPEHGIECPKGICKHQSALKNKAIREKEAAERAKEREAQREKRDRARAKKGNAGGDDLSSPLHSNSALIIYW